MTKDEPPPPIGAPQTPGYSLPVPVEQTTGVQQLCLDLRQRRAAGAAAQHIDGFGANWRRTG